MMQQSTARGAFQRLNGRECLQASTSSNSVPVSSKRSKLDTEVFECVLVQSMTVTLTMLRNQTLLTVGC